MKKIIVFDVPAESGGALTILSQFHENALKDKSKEYFFVTSIPELSESDSVKNIRFPWVKKSWFHRLYFDNFIAHKIVNKYKADEILSLQNVSIKNVGIPQKLYIHQPLPFIDKKYKITKNFKFWVYQNIIGKRIFQSAKTVDEVIVQTQWFKKEVVERTGISESKIVVQPPEITLEVRRFFTRNKDSVRTFFYPASGFSYKNHEVIVKAAKLLKDQGAEGFNIIFTLEGNENKNISALYKVVKENNLPITFIGTVPYEQVLDYYSRSILLFPSHIETFGLPMLEARRHKTAILASNYPFSKEILNGYDDARLLNPDKPEEWAHYIKMISTSIGDN